MHSFENTGSRHPVAIGQWNHRRGVLGDCIGFHCNGILRMSSGFTLTESTTDLVEGLDDEVFHYVLLDR